MNVTPDVKLNFDLTVGGASALNSAAVVLNGDDFNGLIVRINQLVKNRHGYAVLRLDVEQAWIELFPEKRKLGSGGVI